MKTALQITVERALQQIGDMTPAQAHARSRNALSEILKAYGRFVYRAIAGGPGGTGTLKPGKETVGISYRAAKQHGKKYGHPEWIMPWAFPDYRKPAKVGRPPFYWDGYANLKKSMFVDEVNANTIVIGPRGGRSSVWEALEFGGHETVTIWRKLTGRGRRKEGEMRSEVIEKKRAQIPIGPHPFIQPGFEKATRMFRNRYAKAYDLLARLGIVASIAGPR
jgi:hypothetical protein